MAPPKANGFMVFTNDFKEKHGRKMNVAQAVSAAGELWKKMSKEQREPYNKRASEGSTKKSKREKLTCLGTPIELVEKQHKEKEQRVENIRFYIQETVTLGAENGILKNEKFYFVMVNYFVRILQTDKYVPAEIGLIEFSLENGVSRKFHSFVNPQIEFYGNVYDAKNHSESTHKLPLPPNSLGEKNLAQILTKILEFVKIDAEGRCPPLYTDVNAVNYVNSALNYLSEGDAEDDIFDIYPIQELFYIIKSLTCEGVDKPKNRFVTDAIFERDIFEYSNNIACDYHEQIDSSSYCSLSKCIRWAYTFADYIGKGLSIKYIPGKHVPDNVNVDIVMNPTTTNRFDEQSIDGVFSALNMESTFEIFKDFENASAISNLSSFKSVSGAKTVTPGKENDDYNFLANSSDYNPWKRQDDSKPPASRYFSLELSDEEDRPLSTTSRRGVGRGRGIAILDDIKPYQ